MEATTLFAAVAALIVLAVTSLRHGADSRERYASKERELAARGIVWDDPLASGNTRPELEAQSEGDDCFPAPCGV